MTSGNERGNGSRDPPFTCEQHSVWAHFSSSLSLTPHEKSRFFSPPSSLSPFFAWHLFAWVDTSASLLCECECECVFVSISTIHTECNECKQIDASHQVYTKWNVTHHRRGNCNIAKLQVVHTGEVRSFSHFLPSSPAGKKVDTLQSSEPAATHVTHWRRIKSGTRDDTAKRARALFVQLFQLFFSSSFPPFLLSFALAFSSVEYDTWVQWVGAFLLFHWKRRRKWKHVTHREREICTQQTERAESTINGWENGMEGHREAARERRQLF